MDIIYLCHKCGSVKTIKKDISKEGWNTRAVGLDLPVDVPCGVNGCEGPCRRER